MKKIKLIKSLISVLILLMLIQISLAICGDDITQAGEACDGLDLNGFDCTTVAAGFSGGTLACESDCNGYDVQAAALSDECFIGHVPVPVYDGAGALDAPPPNGTLNSAT